MSDPKKYILVKDRNPTISEVLNDCTQLCVPTTKGEPLSSILNKMCGKIQQGVTPGTPTDNTCPKSDDKLLFKTAGGLRWKTWDSVKCCLMTEIFGTGLLTVTGADLQANIYTNPDIPQDFLLFAWNVPNFLIRGTEWNYVTVAGVITGFEVLISYLSTDNFTIFPNPVCD